MTEFESLLNINDNDNPNIFPFNWEYDYWGDKVATSFKSDVERTEVADPVEQIISFNRFKKSDKHGKRVMRDRRHKNRLKSLYEDTNGWFPSGVSKRTNDRGAEYYTRFYRGHASKYLKEQCNRKFRRCSDLDSFSQKGLYRKHTEFWWELW